MKVCTDACVLGAYADVGSGAEPPVERILDIGTGTGLLALMAAQRNPMAFVDAVEIDEQAYEQAVDNVAGTPFAERVRVWHGPIQTFMRDSYDRILTNPPFYTNHLRSPDAAVNRALHTDALPFAELMEVVVRLLRPDGQWWVLLPPYETGLLTELARAQGLRAVRRLQLQHNAHKKPFRTITGFAYGVETGTDETLLIYETDNRTYTPAFRALLQDFYLIF